LIIVDERFRTSVPLRDAIFAMAWSSILLLQTQDALGSVRFMNYQNSDRRDLSPDEREAAEFLEKLYVMSSAGDVAAALNDSPPGPGQEAIKLPTLIKTQNVAAGRGLLHEEVQKIMKTEKVPDRHVKILALLRDMKLDYSIPFDAQNLTLKEFDKQWKAAVAASKNQPKVISNLGHTAVRSVQQLVAAQKNRSADKDSAVLKTKIIIYTGAPIDRYEKQSIKTELEQVVGGADQFSLQTVQVAEDDRDDSATHQKHLDGTRQALQDIYDYVRVNIWDYFKYGPEGALLAKIHFSNKPNMDKMDGKKGEFYGKTMLIQNELPHYLPDKTWIQAALGIVTDENREAPNELRPTTQTAPVSSSRSPTTMALTSRNPDRKL
jgi:hypothetical protein